ncbi:retention module-containing protein [Pseudohaliea rubra]|uniref:Calx-beta domain-containing protein n=1 Tax=Pseudohaliea rubra DSM 19751 TaxID=1265313 RepID=A0A095VP42_9GAMM|nr:retention module-containing protein [Pseudohaliea rubra]KGE03120.1 hypothetical protein HRUBRA_02352 [Pseudohaliea rubra DSM 19751]
MATPVIATIATIEGTAYARNAEGALRQLRVGDELRRGETLVTPEGSRVDVDLADGQQIAIADVPEVTMDSDMLAEFAASADEAALRDDTLDEVIAALEGDGDLSEILEATAAGAGADGTNAGSTFIRLSRIAEDTPEFSGVRDGSGNEDALLTSQADAIIGADAVEDFEETSQDTPVTIAVLDNDNFVEGAVVTAVTDPENGSATINPDGTVTYTPDPGFFGEDTFVYNVVTPDGNVTDSATVTIVVVGEAEPAPLPTLSINDDTVVEGNTAEVTVTLSAPSEDTVTVGFASSDGTATVTGGDYNPATGTLTFAPGVTETTILVQTNNDELQEGTEFLNLTLADPVNAGIADGEGIVEIIDDFTPTPPTISIDEVTVQEGAVAELTLTLSAAADTPVTVDFATADDTATVTGGDYNPETGTVTFAPGTTTTTVQIQTNTDDVEEGTERGFVNLSNAVGATIAESQGIFNIIDATEPPPPPPPPPPEAPTAEPADLLVEEAALAAGSNPASDAETVTGGLAVSGGSGSYTFSIVGGGAGSNGTLTIDPDTGAYNYTLTTPFAHTPGVDDGVTTEDNVESFEILISDANGTSTTATITADIVDDVPTARLASEIPPEDGQEQAPTGTPSLQVDETPGAQDDPEDNVTDRSSTAAFSGLFADDSDGSTPATSDDVQFGADGAGSVAYSLSVTVGAGGDAVGEDGVESGLYAVDTVNGGQGEQIRLYDNSGTLEGRIGGAPGEVGSVLYFTIAVDSASGAITLTQADGVAIWHGDAADPDDVASLDGEGDLAEGGTVSYQIDLVQTVTDFDGDTDSASVDLAAGIVDEQTQETSYAFNFGDDGPSATDLGALAEPTNAAEGATITGSLDFTTGVDGGSVTHVKGIALAFDADDGGYSQSIDIDGGSVKVKADGSYSFTAEDPSNESATATFTVTDNDGDTAQAAMYFQVTDANVPTANPDSAAVDDEGLAGGIAGGTFDDETTDSATFSDTLPITTGGDTPVTVDFAAMDGETGTVGQETVSYGWSTGVLTATITSSPDAARDGLTLFTVTVDDATTGDYTVALDRNVLHAQGPNNENETDPTVDLTYTVTDSDNSEASSTLTISFDDDEPTATDLGSEAAPIQVAEGVSTPEGTLVFAGGADGATVTHVNGTALVFDETTGFSQAVSIGTAGTVTVKADGTYVFTGNDPTDNPLDGRTTFTVTDADGDTAQANMYFRVTDANMPTANPDSAAVDDEGLAGGIAGGTFDDTSTDSATFSDTLPITTGGDTPVTVDFAAMDGATGTVGQETVSYGWSTGVLTATIDASPDTARIGETLFTVTVDDATTGDYTVALARNVLHAQGPNNENETDPTVDLTYTVTDSDNSEASSTLTVSFDDDEPTAAADSDAIIGTDDLVIGNVLTGLSEAGTGGVDAQGADGAEITAVSGTPVAGYTESYDYAVVGSYGILELNADGSYQYTRTSGSNSGGNDVFTYTLTDADGDEATADLTVNVDAGPTGPAADLVLESIDESELVGLNSGDPFPSTSDTLQFTQGSSSIDSFAFGDLSSLNGDSDPNTAGGEIVWVRVSDTEVVGYINGDETTGEPAVRLTLTSDPLNATATATMTLLEPFANAFGDDIATNFEAGSIDVIATDTAGLQATGTVILSSIDDVPEVGTVIDPDPITNTSGETAEGAVPLDGGADEIASVTVTGPTIDGIAYNEPVVDPVTGAVTLTAVTDDANATEVFKIVVQTDGNYVFTLITPEAATETEVGLLSPVSSNAPTNTYIFESTDGEQVSVTGRSDTGDGLVNTSTNGLGVDSQNLDDTEVLSFSLDSPALNVTFSTFTAQGGDFEVRAYDATDALIKTESDNIGPDGDIIATFPSDASRIELEAVDAKAKISTITYDVRILPDGAEYEFLISGTDSDGDSTTPTATTVTIEPGVGSGSLVDGVVEGISYTTSSALSGETGTDGNFSYRAGDTVTFNIGNLVLGSFSADEALADGKVFLQEIAGVGLENLNDEYVENMAVLLQSLDNDADPYNNIVINDGVHQAFSDDSFNLATISDGDLRDVLLENGYAPVSEGEAMEHVKDMIIEHAGEQAFEARVDDGTVLLASEGDDVFAFDLAAADDSVSDIRIAGFGMDGADSLDLRDLLVGEEAADNLGAYLDVSYDGANTIIKVSAEGGFTGGEVVARYVDQTITLEGVDLVGDLGGTDAIQAMIDAGKLTVDQ